MKSLDASYFNELYGKNMDPWNFDGSEYEKRKYEQTILMISEKVYNNAFEIGCSNGVLTKMLSPRCNKILAVDSSSIAVENAKKRLGEDPKVTVMEMEVPQNFPEGHFDLILLSEVGYFLTIDDLKALRKKIIDALLPNGTLLLVHWTPFVEEFPLTGNQVHETFLEMCGDVNSKPLMHIKNKTQTEYRMDMFQRQ